MQGVFMGHLASYNENQIRDKLLLVLIFFMNNEAKSTLAGGAYGNRLRKGKKVKSWTVYMH